MNIALYLRVSTVRQAENDLSLPDQLRQLRVWAKNNGHLIVREFTEAGASGTSDEKRPVFRQMISEALAKPAGFDAIVVHSLSRFYRDGIEFGVVERKLNKNRVKVISITQPSSDDASGEMTRRIITMFDEHQSRETAKHVIRTMRENAAQGYFNGSRAPFGYLSATTDVSGCRGRKKKKLAIHEAEADIVRRAFELYEHGIEGKVMGCKEIARYLTDAGLLMRGKPWSMQKIQAMLSDTTYMGEYYFGMRDSKNKVMRPVSEWIKSSIPAIVDAATFERVRLKRESRAPAQRPPGTVGSTTLLTGVLKCSCGACMTLATGKGGMYKYYKCSKRISFGNHVCRSANLPVRDTDQIVLNLLADQIFAKDRLQTMIADIRKHLDKTKEDYQSRINEVNRQLRQLDERYQRLMEGVETGVLPLNEATQQRAQQLQTAREALLIELAQVKQMGDLPEVESVKPAQVEKFAKALHEKLLAPDSIIAKSYLNMLVDEIIITKDAAKVKGSYAGLAEALQKLKMGNKSVPRFNMNWCRQSDSN